VNAVSNVEDFLFAPELVVTHWLNCSNAEQEITLAKLRGKVVVVHVFQMLCAGCVMNATPQAVRVWEHYRQHYRQSAFTNDFVLVGLHSVFEHHHVMTPEALAVYLHEFRIPFPVAVDRPGTNSPIPETMQAYDMQGTPTTLLIDRAGRLRKHQFGAESDKQLIREIDQLLGEVPGA
jgi:hypothetical protein